MAVRLYPNCSVEEMERLAQVPARTWARLEALEAKKPQGGPAMDAWYETLFADQDLHNLSSLKVFGWGRLSPEARQYITSHHLSENEYAGETNDPVHAQALIRAMGVSAEGITSVGWC